MTNCPACEGVLVEVKNERILPDPEFTEMSDDDMLDFFGEEITGNYDKWGADQITFVCAQCGNKYKTKHDED
jgi:hypothetical protein